MAKEYSYTLINVTAELVCLGVAAGLLVGLLITKAYKTKLSRILLYMLFVNCGVMLFDAIAWGFGLEAAAHIRPLLLAANFLVYLLAYMYAVLVSHYVISYISLRNPGISRAPTVFAGVLTAGMIVLTVVSQFSGLLYSIDENNIFRAGPLEPISYIVSFSLLMIHVAVVLRNRRHLDGRDVRILLLFLLIPSGAIIFEMLWPNLMFTYVSSTIAFVVLYVSVQIQQEVNALETESELKTAIMLSQIQPHFLYNTLTAIKQLSDGKPKAQEAIVTFSHYLRANMDALSQKEPVPFAKELEHVRQYLWLEQLRFEDRLNVEYDIGTENFRLPVLTVQPIVENAVLHGVTKRDDGGTVRLRTQETADGVRIIVEDTGVGFLPDEVPEAGRSHIGLENVRTRLAVMCGGSLKIESTPDAGTLVTIELPKR